MGKDKTSRIKFTIQLNDQNVPSAIHWYASDSQHKEDKKTKTMMINLWDPEEKNTLNINLWTKEMQVDEMYVHFYQSMMSWAETLENATGCPFAIEEMKNFCNNFDARVKQELTKTPPNS